MAEVSQGEPRADAKGGGGSGVLEVGPVVEGGEAIGAETEGRKEAGEDGGEKGKGERNGRLESRGPEEGLRLFTAAKG